jgi:hypothetical protein
MLAAETAVCRGPAWPGISQERQYAVIGVVRNSGNDALSLCNVTSRQDERNMAGLQRLQARDQLELAAK